jgi:hypothetical protein
MGSWVCAGLALVSLIWTAWQSFRLSRLIERTDSLEDYAETTEERWDRRHEL